MTDLRDFPLNPILPAADGGRARAFYRDVLGLALLSGPDQDPMMFRAGDGTSIVLSEMRDRTPPPYPVVAFLVRDIEALVGELERRGAEFVPLPAGTFAGVDGTRRGAVTDFGVVRSAWLRDPEGNLLALNELAV
jgi:catechol 2,3-dioxygenase-like lactoylglutathione lyase family enzyme